MKTNRDVIAIYSRKSRFTGKGESIGNQVELCREYIRTVYGEEYGDRALVFEDEGFSGGNLNRPDFQKMMAAARDRQFQAVVVYRLDRISRNIGDFSALIQELGRLGIDFVSIRESFDTASPIGRAMMYIASVFSQLERETIGERIRDNMHELAKTGRWLGGVTPTGYTSEAVKSMTADGKTKKACKLKLIPEEARIVRKIYELYGESDSLTKTEAELQRRHIKTKTGRNFTRFSIKGILQNPVYLIADQDAYQYFAEKQAELFSGPEEFDGVRGMLAYHRTDQEKGRATVYLPVSQWIVAVGQHPGIIPGRFWVPVQDSLERNKSKSYRKPRSNMALLGGILWCGCGERMYPKASSRVTAEGKPVYTYVCKGKEHDKGRPRSVNGNGLDRAILEQVQGLQGDAPLFLEQLEKGKRLYSGGGKGEGREWERLQQQQEQIRCKIRRLVDSLASFEGSPAASHVKERLEELHAQSVDLEARMEELEQGSGGLDREELERMAETFAEWGESVNKMTVEEKRAAVREVVRKVIWDGQEVQVVLWGGEENAPLCEDSK